MAPPTLGPPRPRAMHAARAPHASRAARAARHSNCTRCAHSASVATTPASVSWGGAGVRGRRAFAASVARTGGGPRG
eukprot:scaffold13649_cov23-Phaeocystis_antarctica.AAC.2